MKQMLQILNIENIQKVTVCQNNSVMLKIIYISK